ncbi:hypothetical protein SLW70_05245 [Flavobacterium sp. NG2]|uniref:hypothetical protein n=1 Tax=Flavobacterium sp. NG2 TaxID=3097547 RepID=UPI002A828395|nr:hypothetical protein [Flavobacterium sp. NG2]WPR72543.1 hypothetical protein SLW70_05245 [Flavobacterium sp. NG2]
MIKKIVTSLCLFLGLLSFAQEGSSSPYSFYGIGEVRFKGTAENRAMAGIAVEQDSIHINLQNPASFASLKLTSFTLGGTFNTSTLKTDSKSESAQRSTLDYMAVGLPLGKFGVGFGLIPYSSVGYKIRKFTDESSTTGSTYTSTGGVNKVFLGLGYKLSSKLSIGADVNYNFGTIEVINSQLIENVQSGTRETNSAKMSGVNFNIGTMYQAKLTKTLNFYSSLNYTFANDLNSENSRVIVTSSESVTVEQADRTLPFASKVSLSAGIGQAKKWLLAAKIAVQGASDISNSYNDLSNVSYERAESYNVGGYYIPDYASFTNYAKRIVYRGGLKFEKTGLVVNSESINNLGLTLGLGMPITGTFSNINIGFELGKKGTTSSGLIQENYANISVGLSLNDKWFEKRKFN